MVEKRKLQLLPTAPTATFFSTGCALLDCVLGGGWARGRVSNVVGGTGSGKTLLAIEACANFTRTVPGGRVTYVEAESAFDPAYAATLGFPAERLSLVDDISTIEDLWKRIEAIIQGNEEHFVVIDSLDALTDDAEVERDFGAATYGATKAKLLSEGFRKYIRGMGSKKLTMMVISQTRDKFNAPAFGKQVQRSGGKALEFYCSQILWLYSEAQIKKTVGGIERSVGVNVKARCEKNKCGMPWREAQLQITYGYGVEDILVALEWLSDAKPEALKELNEAMTATNYKRYAKNLDRNQVSSVLIKTWDEIEAQFRPDSRKYT